MRKLKVKALYNAIPEKLIINVSHLGLGKTVKVGELKYEGLELTAKEAVVCRYFDFVQQGCRRRRQLIPLLKNYYWERGLTQ